MSSRSASPAGEEVGSKDSHKTSLQLFIQSFISHRQMNYTQAQELFTASRKVCKVQDPIEFVDFLANAQTLLENVGMEIKLATDQLTTTPILVLVNAVSDAVSQLATEYKAEELAFFRLLIEAIMTAPRMSYTKSWNDALRISQDEKITPALTKIAAGIILKSLVAKGWMDLSSERYLTLSPKTLMELNEYIKATFPATGEEDEIDPQEGGFVECFLCTHLVTIGYACPNVECHVRLHHACANKAMANRTTCRETNCEAEWTKNARGLAEGTPIGISALKPVQAQSDSEEDELPTQEPTQKRRKSDATAPSKKSRKNAAAIESEEED